jgi:hypothetical protein
VKRLKAVSPVLVALDGPARVEVQLEKKTGATVKWSGKIQRLEGVKGDVALTLEGLPKGVTDPKVTVTADKSEFSVALKLPPTADPGETRGITLFGTLRLASNAAALIRSPNVELVYNVLPIKEASKASN